MAQNSKIEWTHHTFNPWRGCTKVSAGCDHCYADTMSKRNPGTLGVWGKYGTRVIASEAMWKEPVKWNHEAEYGICPVCHGKKTLRRTEERIEQGEGLIDKIVKEEFHDPCTNCNQTGRIEPYRSRVFCASLADVFEGNETLPIGDSRAVVASARERLFQLIDKTPNLDWLLLTKRPQNIHTLMPLRWRDAGMYPDNVWLGTSVEDQKTADERIPHLLNTPAAVRFLSVEPLLGPIDFSGDWWCESCQARLSGGRVTFEERCDADGSKVEWASVLGNQPEGDCGIDWVIVGGESGPNARPMHVDWVRSIRDQCVEAGVPVFVKQLGANVWDRNDAGFDGDYPHEWPMDTDTDDWRLDPARNYQGARCRVILGDRKGGNWSEWPEDLRIREFPEAK